MCRACSAAPARFGTRRNARARQTPGLAVFGALEDLLPFSPRVYWRLFALENEAVWPGQPVGAGGRRAARPLPGARTPALRALARPAARSGLALDRLALRRAALWHGQLGRADACLGVLRRGRAACGPRPLGPARLAPAGSRRPAGHGPAGRRGAAVARPCAARRTPLARSGGRRDRAGPDGRRHARPAGACRPQPVDGSPRHRPGAVAGAVCAHARHDGCLAGWAVLVALLLGLAAWAAPGRIAAGSR